MSNQLRLPNVKLFTPNVTTEDLLRAVHTDRFVDDLKKAWYYEGVLLSVGAVVEATERLLSGELTNALVFDIAAGHHAERDSAWGGTYASAAGPAIFNARRRFGNKKVAILDTDCHHGNGTRDIFLDDHDILHVCICSDNTSDTSGTKVCLDAGWQTTDDAYLSLVRREFMPRVRWFKPNLIWHNFGHDTCQGDYGDRGLTPGFFPRLAEEVNQLAREECGGKYLVLTHGGYLHEVAELVFPNIIEVLAGTK
jgi:acetoin utilization deacetylase AcuC-like enzyme